MIGLTNAGGSSGGGLNFAVVGGLTQPASPRENTIWVKTDTKITSWAFSPEAPTNPDGGMVFFKTALASSAGFNALRKNEIAVLPTSAQQFVGGKWANVEAHVFIGGKWVQFSFTAVYLYNKGEIFADVIGSFKSVGKAFSKEDEFIGSQAPTIEYLDAAMKLIKYPASGVKGGIVITELAIDLTSAESLVCELGDTLVSNASQVNNGMALNVWDSIPKYTGTKGVAYDKLNKYNGSENKITIDVSGLTGNHYIGFALWGYLGKDNQAPYVTVNALYLM